MSAIQHNKKRPTILLSFWFSALFFLSSQKEIAIEENSSHILWNINIFIFTTFIEHSNFQQVVKGEGHFLNHKAREVEAGRELRHLTLGRHIYCKIH